MTRCAYEIAGICRASGNPDHKGCAQPVQEVWLRSAGWKGNGQESELLKKEKNYDLHKAGRIRWL